MAAVKHAERQLTWVLASLEPERLAQFYAALLGLDPRPGLSPSHWLVTTATGLDLQFYRPSRQRSLAAQGRAWSPCFSEQTEDEPLQLLQHWCEQACEQGAQQGDAPRLEPFGAECWMKDPDGNDFLLLVTPSSSSTSPL